MSLKTVIFAACLVFFVNGDDDAHIINDCLQPGTTPTVIYDQEVSKAGSFLHVQEETLRVPLVGFSPGPLTCITVTNLDSDADGGYPSIKEGGIGEAYVTLYLKSQLNKGFNFRISIYYDKDAKATTTV